MSLYSEHPLSRLDLTLLFCDPGRGGAGLPSPEDGINVMWTEASALFPFHLKMPDDHI